MKKLFFYSVFSTLAIFSIWLYSETSQAHETVPTQKAVISYDMVNLGRTIPKDLWGTNIQWASRGDGLLDRGGFINKETLDLIKKQRYTQLRFPGGALANTYRWKDAIGAFPGRKNGLNFSKKAEPSYFGTGEFIELCKSLNCGASMTVNANAPVREAADWVEFCNGSPDTEMGKKREALGYSTLDVKYWEIGNELFSPHEEGHLSASAYADTVIKFSKNMKAKDSSIKIGVVLHTSFLQASWVKRVMPHLLTWNETVLKKIGTDIDYVVVHFYAPFDQLSRDEDLSRLVWAGAEVFEQNLFMIENLLNKYSNPSTKIILSEYGTFFGGKRKPDPRIGSTENALFCAQILFKAMANPRVIMAHHWSMLNNEPFGVLQTLSGPPRQLPTSQVFPFLSPLKNTRLLEIDIKNSPHFSVSAKGNVPSLSQLPSLVGVGGMGIDNKIIIALVNLNIHHSQNVEIKVSSNHTEKSLYILKSLSSKKRSEAWDESSSSTLKVDQGMLKFQLPANSLNLITQK